MVNLRKKSKPTEINKEMKSISKSSTSRKRKYNKDDLKYGFIESSKDTCLPLYLVCSKVLENEYMIPNKLK